MPSSNEKKAGGGLSLNALQARFAAALQNGDDAALADLGIQASGNIDAAKRFAVYRNNVFHSLTQALADAHPVVERLVGEEFFRALARAHLDAGGLPKHAPLHDYGAGFADFIEGFAPAAGLPWLGDVARVERTHLRAWHSADAPMNAGAGIIPPSEADAGNDAGDDADPERIAGMALLLHPSLTMEALNWPAVAVWEAHQQSDVEAGLAKIRMRAQKNIVVAVRGRIAGVAGAGEIAGEGGENGETMRVFSLPWQAQGFLHRLGAGERVLDAAHGMEEEILRQVLASLAQNGAILGLRERATPSDSASMDSP